MKLTNGIEIISLEDSLARVRNLAPFGAADIAADERLGRRLADPEIVSQWALADSRKNDNFNFQTVGDVKPRDEDYIYVKFRALSKTVVPGHWIDWSKDNVLEESVPLLMGATVYPNHEFTDINNWLGSVSQSLWDAEGGQSQGVPGINAEYKIDALMNPRIARGLLMKPPAIHSTSMTVLFEFDYSHPDIALENKWKFFDMLGEEVEGEIVRLIVTKIREYWEAGLVFQGADRLAKQYDEADEQEDFAEMQASADKTNRPGAGFSAKEADVDPSSNRVKTAKINEEKTMKLTNEQKSELGIEFDGDDVLETEILKAAQALAAKLKPFEGVNLAELQSQAKAGKAFIEMQRAEVTRLAKLAELGADEGDLDDVISQSIADADFNRLVKLNAYFEKKAVERFPNLARSSQEDSAAVEAAGGVKQQTMTAPTVGLH